MGSSHSVTIWWMSLHSWHSKVRMWKPKWLGVICASIVTLLQIGHSGRKDMVARLDEAGAQHSQSPGICRYRAGDESIMARCNTGTMFRFAHLRNEINDWFTNWSAVRLNLSKSHFQRWKAAKTSTPIRKASAIAMSARKNLAI